MTTAAPSAEAIKDPSGEPAFEERVAAEVIRLHATKPISTLFDRLAGVLPADLHYHSINHTFNVMCEAVRFALFEKLADRSVLLLAVAASYHDAGYVFRRANNEELGAELAKDAMHETGQFSDDEIAIVGRMILDTQLVDTGSGPKQVANSELSKYLLDADLANFGREDFFERLEAFLLESKSDRLPVLKRTLALMNSHSWFTNAARTLRQAKKEENVAKLTEMIASLPA